MFALAVCAADDKPPADAAPSFVYAKAVADGDKVRLVVYETRYQSVHRMVEVQVNGQGRRITVSPI